MATLPSGRDVLVVVIALALAVTAIASAAQSSASIPPIATVVPKDDAAGEPGFGQFRRDVDAAAAICTEASLREVLAPSAETDHLTMPPSPAFWRYWTVEDEGGLPALCRTLRRAVALGAVRYGELLYCAPYLACAGGTPRALPFGEFLVGVSPRVLVRSRPTTAADVIAAARFPVLVDCGEPPWPCGGGADDSPPEGWKRVRLGKRVGYVSSDQVRDQDEPSVIIRRLPVGWRIEAVNFSD
jgi:hypothetical protein